LTSEHFLNRLKDFDNSPQIFNRFASSSVCFKQLGSTSTLHLWVR